MGEPTETSKTSVKTYLPTYQKEAWQNHAESLDMSQSEFVRTMVQAGRRGFDVTSEDGTSTDTTPGGNGLERQVLELVSSEPRSWDELLDAVVSDIESRLDETLSSLQASNRIQYSGRDGGYVPVEDSDGV